MNITINKLKVFYIVIALCLIGSFLFVNNNFSFYERDIIKVIESELISEKSVIDRHENRDVLATQLITAEIKNGDYKGSFVTIENEYSESGAYDQAYKKGDELFVSLNDSPSLTASIQDVKRDKNLLLITWVFIIILLIIGRKQGLYAVISLAINAIILSFALDFYIKHVEISLLLICGFTVILFTIISLLLVNGFNEKTYAAIIGTLLGTFISLLITYIVMWLTNENGLRYEEMDFLTRPYKMVFMAGLFVGSLGAVMDVAITMSASIFSLYEKNNTISVASLKKSGLEIGKDIMGTMTNILFFAYISGSIPLLILYFKNGSPLLFTLSMNLSLELARALAGGIGIVITIPIGIYVSIYFVNRKRAKI